MREDDVVVKDIGDSEQRFKDGNQKSNVAITPEQTKKAFLRKKFVPVIIEIRTEAPIGMTKLFDTFVLWMDPDKQQDNIKVLQEKMKLFSDNIDKLVTTWIKELGGQ